MPAAPLPVTERQRLAALRSYAVLDTSPEPALDGLARLAGTLGGMPVALISLLDGERAFLKARIGLAASELPRSVAPCAHAILRTDGPLLVGDLRADARFADNPLVTDREGFRAYAGWPLVDGDGHALGALSLLDHAPRALPAAALPLIGTVAQAVVTALELRRVRLRQDSQSLVDPLTLLPNRFALREALARAIARQRRDRQPFSLLHLDVDGLRRVNDAQGRAEGDALLRTVADALRMALREEDMPARLDGDAFAALLVGGDGSEISVAADRLRMAVKAGMDLQGWAATVSIGAVCFLGPPEDEDTALALADREMYRAKAMGGDQVACAEELGRPPLAAD